MIRKVIKKANLRDFSEVKENLSYWLSKTPEERVGAVEYLRRTLHGSSASFKDLFSSFNAHKVDYLIVGTYALAYHGAPRYTGDMAILVRPSPENAHRILKALEAFGFGSVGLTAEDFTAPDKVIQLGVAPVRIDIVTSITGVSWEKAAAGRVKGNYGDTVVNFIGRKEFIRNKQALGRKRDQADLEALGVE